MKPSDKEIQRDLNEAIRTGLLEVYCECGRKLSEKTLRYNNSEKSRFAIAELGYVMAYAYDVVHWLKQDQINGLGRKRSL